MDNQDVRSLGFSFSKTCAIVLISSRFVLLLCSNNFLTLISKVVAKTRLQECLQKVSLFHSSISSPPCCHFLSDFDWSIHSVQLETLLWAAYSHESAEEVHNGVWCLLEVNLLYHVIIEVWMLYFFFQFSACICTRIWILCSNWDGVCVAIFFLLMFWNVTRFA